MSNEGRALTALWWDCLVCGYRNAESESRCHKCGRRLQTIQAQAELNPSPPTGNPGLFLPPGEMPEFASSSTAHTKRTSEEDPSRKASPNVPGQAKARPSHGENLRKHLNGRVQDYRYRRLNPILPLQFEEENVAEPKIIPIGINSGRQVRRVPRPATRRRPRRPRPLPPGQSALNFPAPPPQPKSFALPAVAPFRLRMLGHVVDFALSLAALLVFLVTLKLTVGPLVSDQFLWISGGCAYLFFMLLYGALFFGLAGATPGMLWMGLRWVSFDGIPAPRQQLIWRLLGVFVSAGSFFLGFLWAAVDEERLSWHDRISKTFLTTANRP